MESEIKQTVNTYHHHNYYQHFSLSQHNIFFGMTKTDN